MKKKGIEKKKSSLVNCVRMCDQSNQVYGLINSSNQIYIYISYSNRIYASFIRLPHENPIFQTCMCTMNGMNLVFCATHIAKKRPKNNSLFTLHFFLLVAVVVIRLCRANSGRSRRAKKIIDIRANINNAWTWTQFGTWAKRSNCANWW